MFEVEKGGTERAIMEYVGNIRDGGGGGGAVQLLRRESEGEI